LLIPNRSGALSVGGQEKFGIALKIRGSAGDFR
jgi:hypothetical protein